jgi:SAM-dependent methyltransferase
MIRSNCSICNGFLKPIKKAETFLECNKCGVIYNTAFSITNYSDTYFTEEYKSQYGKSYVDDYNSLYDFAQKRITVINRLCNNNKIQIQSILDIGSALGFFLKAASDNFQSILNKNLYGCEISTYATDYSISNYGFTVTNESFENYVPNRKFDLITAWYCLEHLPDPIGAIKKIFSMLSDKGLVAFSFPSAFGPMRKFNLQKWKETHPQDHSINFTPLSLRILLKQSGFSSIVIKPASYHPERILNSSRIGFFLFSYLYKKISDITGFSDTIEVYACKR